MTGGFGRLWGMKWSTKYKDRLPDDAYLYVNQRTGERKLPVLNAQGNLSVSHLNNAKARLNQTKLPPRERARIRREINELQKLAGVGE